MKKDIEILVIGAGPAGLSAAIEAAKCGAEVLVVDENNKPGGQLFKQIHKFFGSRRHKAGTRGVDIGTQLLEEVEKLGVTVMLNTVAYGFYPNGEGVALAVNGEEGMIVHPKKVIMATGASENPLAFPGWTLPGVVGAGAIQTMINVHRVSVGQRVLMIGSGNVGLIVTYQLLQAGIDVAGIVEAAPQLGGYGVHAGKVRRAGVPLYVGHTVLEAVPNEDMSGVKGAIVAEVDNKFQPIPGTEMEFDVDTVLLSVGLIPENELTRSAGITMDPATSGPVVYENMETSAEGIFASGNVVHVHDLVDFVTAESQKAGKSAAEYVKNGETKDQTCIDIKNGDGVNGIVPQKVRPSNVDKKVEVMFRARNVFTDVAIKVKSNGEELASFKREHMAPGEMEKIVIPKAFLDKVENGEITVSVEKVGA